MLAAERMSPRIGVLLSLAPLACVAATASACSSYRIAAPRSEVLHPFAPIPTEFARVCTIRTSRLSQAVTFAVHDNGTLVGATKGPTFFCYKAEPGDHTIGVQADDTTTVTLHAEGGKSYYLHQKVPFGFMVKCDAVWVTEQAAHELVDDSSYEVIVQAPNGAAPPNAVPFAKAIAR